jgi:probable HAF family extracellular repeat protein
MIARRLGLAVMATAFASCIAAVAAGAAQRYTPVRLETAVAHLAPDGAVAMIENWGVPNKARWVWRDRGGKKRAIPGLPVDVWAAVVSDGRIVGNVQIKTGCIRMPEGYDSCPLHAFIWADGAMHDLGALGGGRTAAFMSLNKHGDAVGWSTVKADAERCFPDGFRISHAMLYRNGKLEDHGRFGGNCASFDAINDAGDIVGTSTDAAGKRRVFLIRNGQTSWFDALDDTVSMAKINGRGEILAVLGSHAHIIRDGRPVDLGTLGGDYSEATAINDAGTVVGSSRIVGGGSRAFVYRDGAMTDLNTLVDWPKDGGAPPALIHASMISATGSILAGAADSSGMVQEQYLLVPSEGIGASLLRPGVVFAYRVGANTSAASVGGASAGDSDLVYRLTAAGSAGLSFDISVSGAWSGHGGQTVRTGDLAQGRGLRVTPAAGDNSAPGVLALPRVSDAVYRDIKAGRSAALAIDGGKQAAFAPSGMEEIDLMLNDRSVRVPALKVQGPGGCALWIADAPAFPMVLRHSCGAAVSASAVYDPEVAAQRIAETLDARKAAATGTILFAFNSAEIAADSKPVLDALAIYARGTPDLRIAVEGHTDNVGTATANMVLSKARAAAVRTYLLEHSGLPPSQIQASGAGLTQPIADNATPEGRARNRRVVFRPAG